MSNTSNLTLPALYVRALRSLLPIFNDDISTSLPSTQQTLQDALTDLDLVIRMSSTLGVFSDNESMDDVGDAELPLMAVEWIKGEVLGRVNGDGIKERLKMLKSSQNSYESFLFLLESYSFPTPPGFTYPSDPSSSSSSSRYTPSDPAARRDAKIKQYRLEKEWKEKVSAGLPDVDVSASPLAGILALMKETQQEGGGDSSAGADGIEKAASRLNISNNASSSTSVNPDSNAHIRQASLSLLTLLLIQTSSQLSSISQETSLLESASMSAQIIEEDQQRERDERERARRKQEGERVGLREEERWRLDMDLVRRKERGRVATLIDDRGKPTQPFTILPSAGLQDLSDRARLGAEVYRSPHRLPTMTIDEYLEEERRRGNILSGGGAASENAPTSTEVLQLASEQDGTYDGEEKEEEKRKKEEDWAVYTEINKKGAGNTMNRG
ncbi:hypothetical protein FFLO_06380 [Filobasidium floriforme]|uniref:TAP42-like protein n=1 Tax=Filobasidium floriforme TaxID=5210 RepID=A0A8K0JKM7_9TREE|nr:hypothetical protein FFLO_06380 [Filobasidium floriforme]